MLFGVYYAIANFNYGKKACIDILEQLNLNPGYHTKQMCQNENKKRISLSAYKVTDMCQKRRKILRARRRHVQDVNIEKEGTTYEPGGYRIRLRCVLFFYTHFSFIFYGC